MKFTHFFKRDDRDIAAQIQAATKTTMDDVSRRRMRTHLFEYTKMRPIRANTSARPLQISQYWFSTFFASHTHSTPVIAAILIVAVSAGTVAAAETALPGDVLYPIKVHVTEEVRATLAVTPKAKADWAVNRAERRLEEAATLALSGKLDDVTRAELDINLDEHARSAEASRGQLASKDDQSDADEIETNIGAMRLARENILGKRGGRAAQATSLAVSASSAVSTSTPEPLEVRHEETKKGRDNSDTIRKGNRTAAKARIEATKKFLERGADNLSSDAREKARERLKNATEAFTTGDTDAARGNKEEASSNFNSALEAATEIETLISSSKDSNEHDSESKNDDSKDEKSDKKENSGSGSDN